MPFKVVGGGVKNTDAEMRDAVVNDATKFAGARLGQVGGSGKDGAKEVTADENLTPDTWYEYTTLTVDSDQTLGLSAAGIMLLSCTDKITINGTISVNGKGKAGGAPGEKVDSGGGGEAGSADNNGGLVGGGGGGGCDNYESGPGGDGGGSTDTGCGAGGAGGTTNTEDGEPGDNFDIHYNIKYCINALGNLLINLGSGGGGGASNASACGGAGGDGGGSLYIVTPELEIATDGAILADGNDGKTGDGGDYGAGGGGAGSGGHIIIQTYKFINNGILSVAGGTGGLSDSNGTDGGDAGKGNKKVILI